MLDSTAADLADANKRSERAVREKELGNNVRTLLPIVCAARVLTFPQDFAAGMYISALVHYSNAIKLQPREPGPYTQMHTNTQHCNRLTPRSILLKPSAGVPQVEPLRRGDH